MKKILWFIGGIFCVFFCFKPFNAIAVWIVSIILNIALAGRAWEIFQMVFYSLSILCFVECLYACLAGYRYRNADPVLKKYYSAIRWNVGAELFSFWCSHFALLNFLYGGFATYCRHQWSPLVVSCGYYLFYTYFIGERLNPYLFLGNRAKHGDLKASYELQRIMEIQQQIYGSGL